MKNNIELIDASCPVVLKLQHRVRTSFDNIEDENGQIVIYGEPDHAEVNGMMGQTLGKAIIVRNEEDLLNVDDLWDIKANLAHQVLQALKAKELFTPG